MLSGTLGAGTPSQRKRAGSCKKSYDGAGMKAGFSGRSQGPGREEDPWRRELRGEAVAGVWAGGGQAGCRDEASAMPHCQGHVAVARMALRHRAGQEVGTTKARRRLVCCVIHRHGVGAHEILME